MVRKILLAIVAGGLAGVLLTSLFSLNFYWTWFFALAVVGLLIYFWLSTRPAWLVLILIFAAGLTAGSFRAISVSPAGPIGDFRYDETIKISGRIIEPPEKRENYLRVVFKPTGGGEKIVARTDLFADLNYGDEAVFAGTINRPDNFLTDTGREFDYISYLAVRGIYHEMRISEVTVITPGRTRSLVGILFKLKNSFADNLNRLLPEPESSLGAGILLGVKESLGRDLETDFRRTGIIHIVVLSGYNVTIIADSIAKALAFLPWKIALSGSAASIILFAIMVGGGATVVRASIMALIAVLATATGRIYDAATALFIAGFIMVMASPGILLHDLSFQLSFLATLGLLYFSPIVLPYVRFLPKSFAIREVAATTLAAQIFVLPWIVYKMGEFSLVSPLVNLLIVPLVPLAMFLSFLAGTIAFIWPLAAIPAGYVAFIPLVYMIKVVEWFAGLPLAAVTIPYLPFILVILIYWLFWQIIRRRTFPQADRTFDKPPAGPVL